MRVASLFSGGKDSTYALYFAQQRGWEVTSLVTLLPSATDSRLYHVPNVHLAPVLSECLEIPLVQKMAGVGEAEELQALRTALGGIVADGVVMGTIASDYQRARVDAICHDLGLRTFAPLWRRDQASLMEDYLAAGFRIIVTGVAAEGLGVTWLGREIDEKAREQLLHLHKKHGLSICGEGGEYETLVVDGPNFRRRLKILESQVEWTGTSGTLNILKAEAVDK